MKSSLRGFFFVQPDHSKFIKNFETPSNSGFPSFAWFLYRPQFYRLSSLDGKKFGDRWTERIWEESVVA